MDALNEITDIISLLEAVKDKAGLENELRKLPKTERDHIVAWWTALLQMDRERYRQRERDFVAGKKREIAESVDGFADDFLEAMLPAGVIVDMIEARLLEATVDDLVHMVYLAFFHDVVDRKSIADDIYWDLREHYEIVLANKVREVGCDPGRVRLEESEELTYLRRRADESASLIVDTYNKNLRSAVEKIVVEYAAAHEGSLAGMNRNVLAYRVRQWEADRAVWKDKQIAVTEATFAAHRTVTQFLLLNAIEARIFIVPVASVCDICAEYVRNSPYTPSQAANIILPAHPSCPHTESIIYDRSTIPGCENLWRGQPVWMLESLAEGGLGSGNWAHTSIGRRGKGKGGSDPGGGTGAYFAGLDAEFGEWKEGAGQKIADEIMAKHKHGDALDDLLREHMQGGSRFDRDSLSRQWVRTGGQVAQRENYKAANKAVQWELYHRLGERREVVLYHGGFLEGGQLRAGASFTDKASVATAFARHTGMWGKVYEIRMPVTAVSMWYGSSKSMQKSSYFHEREYIIKGGAMPKFTSILDIGAAKAILDRDALIPGVPGEIK